MNSELFQNFLKSAVKELKESNIVNPTRSKKQHRMSFLGRAKTDYQEEEVSELGRSCGAGRVRL